MSTNILIVEDDKSLQKYLRELLLDKGYSIGVASDGVEALSLLDKSKPDLVILDLGLPVMSGESVCKEIRKRAPSTRIIILTAKDTISDVVHGLQLGADDYIKKPFEADEFLARIQAGLRRLEPENATLKVGDLELNTQTLQVTRAGKDIQLTAQEFKMLQYLMINRGRVLTRDMILNRIWLFSPNIETRVVDVYIGYLRKKIDKGNSKKLIKSVRGFGYMIKD